MSTALTTSILSIGKFEPPGQRVALTKRTALLQRLSAWREHALTLVLSPPGFGKTTLLTQWHSQLATQPGVATAWLTLDEDDIEPSRFVADVILSLKVAGLDVGALEAVAESGLLETPARAIAFNLLDKIHASQSTIVLILDDYQRAESGGTNEIVETLLRHHTSKLHLAISSRVSPSIHLSALIARGVVQAISTSDLTLSPSESEWLFNGVLTPAEHAALYSRTEGWAVISQLARIWIQRGTERESPLIKFDGRHSEVADYLSEQVLADMLPNTRQFLLDASLFERFCPALLDEVRECNDSATLLSQLFYLDALLVPIDQQRDWFRFHPLFGDFLRDHARVHDPLRARALRLRASSWFLRNGDLLEAVRQAARSGDVAHAVDLTDQAGSWQLIMSRGIGFVSNLMSVFPPAAFDQYPLLSIVRAYLCIKRGEWANAQQCLGKARAILGPSGGKYSREYTIVSALDSSYFDESSGRTQILQLDRFVQTLDDDDHVMRATAYAVCALDAIALAEFAKAQQYSRVGVEDMHAGNCIVGATYCMFHLGQSHYYQGDWERAEDVFGESLKMAEANFGRDSMLKAVADCLSARLLYDRGHLTEASTLVEASLDVIEHQDGWFDIYAAAYETSVRVAFATQGPQKGFSKLQHVRTYAKVRGLSKLERLVEAWQAEYQAVEDGRLGVPASRTTPESHRAGWSGASWRERYAWAVALTRQALANAQHAHALQLADAEIARCIVEGRRAHAVMLDALAAVALKAQGRSSLASERISRVLDFAVTANAVGTFFQLGATAKSLVHDALNDTSAVPALGPRREFLLHVQRALRVRQSANSTQLSSRELEVLRALCQGRSNKSIGRLLGLSDNTVKFHLKHLYRKLGVTSRTAAISKAQEQCLQIDVD